MGDLEVWDGRSRTTGADTFTDMTQDGEVSSEQVTVTIEVAPK